VTTVRFVTWNVARGGTPAAWQQLRELRVDVAVVQEASHSRLPSNAIWSGPALRKNGSLRWLLL